MPRHLPAALGRYALFREIVAPPPRRSFIAGDTEAGLVDVHLLPATDEGRALVQGLCALAHPNVAAVLDTGVAGQDLYFIEEHVEGVPLDRLVGAGGLPGDAFLYVLASLASALGAAERIVGAQPALMVSVPALADVHISWAGQLRVSSAALVSAAGTADTLPGGGRISPARGLAALVPGLLAAGDAGPASDAARRFAELLASAPRPTCHAAWEEQARAALHRGVRGPGGEFLAGRLADLLEERVPDWADEDERLRREGAAALDALPLASPVPGVQGWRPTMTRLVYEPPAERAGAREREGLPSLPPLSMQAVGGMLPGTPYRLLRPLGLGGMGIVYEAEHVHLGRRVAVKVLRGDLRRDGQMLARFRQEARSVARIDHPGVVAVYDFGASSAGELFLVMELLQGQTLTALLAAGPPPVEEAVALLRQVCVAVGAAHQVGVVHRDLKPDNIMLIAQPGQDSAAVKVLDFGIARIRPLDISGLRAGLTGEGQVVGTPEYIAPEQLVGGAIDHRADIYSLGCVAYEVLSGYLPFTGRGPLAVASAHLRCEPAPLRARAPGRPIPEALERAVLRAMAREPVRRFASMADFEAALAAALGPHRSESLEAPSAAPAGDGGVVAAPAPPEAPAVQEILEPDPTGRISSTRVRPTRRDGGRWRAPIWLAVGLVAGLGGTTLWRQAFRGAEVGAPAVREVPPPAPRPAPPPQPLADPAPAVPPPGEPSPAAPAMAPGPPAKAAPEPTKRRRRAAHRARGPRAAPRGEPSWKDPG